MLKKSFCLSLFCLTNSLKPKDIQFAMMENWEKQQIFTLDKLNLENISECMLDK